MKRLLVALLLLAISSCLYAASRAVTINSQDYTVRIHTSEHPTIGAKRTVLLIRKDGDFTNSFYLHLDTDPEAFALLVSLIQTSQQILVRYNDAKISPWGNTEVYAIETLERR